MDSSNFFFFFFFLDGLVSYIRDDWLVFIINIVCRHFWTWCKWCRSWSDWCILRHLIWVYTVCECPFYGTLDLNGLNKKAVLLRQFQWVLITCFTKQFWVHTTPWKKKENINSLKPVSKKQRPPNEVQNVVLLEGNFLIHFSLETPKRLSSKQCRPRSDATGCAHDVISDQI